MIIFPYVNNGLRFTTETDCLLSGTSFKFKYTSGNGSAAFLLSLL